jgi:hypothetical protein
VVVHRGQRRPHHLDGDNDAVKSELEYLSEDSLDWDELNFDEDVSMDYSVYYL